MRQWRVETAGYDLGIFTQVVEKYAHIQAPIIPLKGMGFNIFGDHFHPALALIAPFYAVFQTPVTLLIAQAVLLGLSVIPVWYFTRRRTTVLWTNLIALAYAFSWPLQGLADFDVHEIAFSVLIVPVAIDLFDRRKYWWCLAAASTLLLVREDMFLVVLMFALLLLLKKQWMKALIQAGIALVGYVVAMVIVLPHFSPTGKYLYWSLGNFGPTMGSALANMVTHPLTVLHTLVTPDVKWQTLLILVIPFLGLSMGSPYVLLALPVVAQRFLSERQVLWGTEFHYSAILAPILVLAAVDTAARLQHRFSVPVIKILAVWSVVFVAAGTLIFQGLFPLNRFINGDMLRYDQRIVDLRQAVAMVPKGVCVEADDRIIPQLIGGRYVSLPGQAKGQATWMILDMRQKNVSQDFPPPGVVLDTALAQGFVIVRQYDQIVVLNKPGAPITAMCAAG